MYEDWLPKGCINTVFQSTGVITVAKNIEYESLLAPKEIKLIVVARDTTVDSSSATVTVIVQIVKVTVPMFNQSVSIFSS